MGFTEGLTSAEVRERIAAGQVNSSKQRTSRSYGEIVVKNVCTGFNLLLFILGAAFIVLGILQNDKGQFLNALATVGIIVMNILIATAQEIKAKRRLDRIALLLRPKVTVVRDGIETVIDQADVVKDDVVVLRSGDQALVDGDLIFDDYLEMDESLLTGESRTVRKRSGERIYSGSFCVAGEGTYRVDAFGQDSFASQMLASAGLVSLITSLLCPPGGWEIAINDRWSGNYHINEYYLQLMRGSADPELSGYFKKNLERCRFILHSVEQRRETMTAIARALLARQEAYFSGKGKLVPMTMCALAEEMNVHPSTVSRAVKGKYIKSPAGTILMKKLFCGSATCEKGGELSADHIKERIRALVDSEDKRRPYSDARLVELLVEEGIHISRRAVAKYRDELWIKSSFDRKVR